MSLITILILSEDDLFNQVSDSYMVFQTLFGRVPDPDPPDPPDPHVFGDPDPDPLVRGMDPDPDPAIIMQK
jgi:hypothetical protein